MLNVWNADGIPDGGEIYSVFSTYIVIGLILHRSRLPADEYLN